MLFKDNKGNIAKISLKQNINGTIDLIVDKHYVIMFHPELGIKKAMFFKNSNVELI